MFLNFPNEFNVPIRFINKDILEFREVSLNFRQAPIGVSLPLLQEERWIKDLEAMKQRAKEIGVSLDVRLAKDSNEQKAQVDELITKGSIGVLIIAAIDPMVFEDLVDKAHKSNIKVIAYDRLIKNSDLDLYITFNNKRVGELQGRYLIEKVPKGNYIILSGDPKDNNAKLVKEGAIEFINPLVSLRDIKIVTDKSVENWDPKIAYNIVKESLIANKNAVNAVLAPNDDIAGGAIDALREQGLAGKVAVTGQDADFQAIRRIIEGTQSMTVFKDTRELGKAAIESAKKLALGEAIDTTDTINNGKIDVQSIFISPTLVDKDNLVQTLINSGYLKKEDVYGKNNIK
ncbi:sugar ABC transporter substrate-binding protein [Clostridium sp. 'White wine YQ']|uniref:sugar ABC transporter substrate-binding protein n=1 Tax=Clostridium sp. 'White wine YQ' TaxID=3027474 RepID=UPI0023657B6D|nr:substrate-binding domain-containing protein [Clostridium sp. 'White wine YQ']MDD7793628.1 sugar ABC transporter substrate-binding protein [Clostridium sp. 'White wine YQ']